MSRSYTIVYKCFLIVFLLATGVLVQAGEHHAEELRRLADSLRSAGNIPALAYAAVTADSVLTLEVSGYRRSDSMSEAVKVTRSDYFHLGSNTKAITGFIAAKLVEQGKITWTTPFFSLFPELKKQSNEAFHRITLQDLLSHRAGIPPFTSGFAFRLLPQFGGTVSERRLKFVEHILKNNPMKPGEQGHLYSNAGYSVAAAMLEKTTGKTWEDLVQQMLADSLQLHVMTGWPNKKDPNQPWGHWEQSDSLQPVPGATEYNLALAEPAGDLAMPLADYARFIQLQVQGLAGKDNFLRAATYEFLHYGLKDYSIGWGNINTPEKKRSAHAGSAGTFFCYTVVDPKGRAFIAIANSGTAKAEAAVKQMLQEMMKRFGGRQ